MGEGRGGGGREKERQTEKQTNRQKKRLPDRQRADEVDGHFKDVRIIIGPRRTN